MQTPTTQNAETRRKGAQQDPKCEGNCIANGHAQRSPTNPIGERTMTTFTIDSHNNLSAWDKCPAKTTGIEVFSSGDDLAALAGGWPSARLVEIWNSLAGVVPVKKFTDRKSAAGRIWKQIQYLAPRPVPAPAKKPNTANATTPSDDATKAREGSKKAEVLDLLRRPQGASLDEIMTTTGWQAHTVRGFISGTLTKKMGLTVESLRGEDKVRTYRIAS